MKILHYAVVAALLGPNVAAPLEAKRKKSAQSQPAAPATETLIDNVNGYTLDDKARLIRFTGIVISGDGRVKALLKQGDARSHARYRLDAGGRTLLPGMIDSEAHVMAYGLQAFRVDLHDASSAAEAMSRVRQFAVDNPRAKWIIGSGWREALWGRMPTAADLESAGVDRPIWLISADGHAGVTNRNGLAQLALPANLKNPAGGSVGRLADGRLSGLFSDQAMTLVERVLPKDNPVIEEAALTRALKAYAAHGITFAQDMGTSLSDWMLYRRFGDSNNLTIRIYAVAQNMGVLDQVAPLKTAPWLYDGKLTMRGVLISADGGIATGGAWLGSAYADSKIKAAGPALTDAQVRNLMSKASMIGAQSVLDARGDAALQQVADALVEITSTYGTDKRYRVNYMTLAKQDIAVQLASHGALAAITPAADGNEATKLQSYLGPERASQAHNWAMLYAAKLPLALGSGQSPRSPFAVMQAAVANDGGEGRKLSLEQAFEAQTRGGAYAAFSEDNTGTLTPGKYADFIIVDRDIFSIPPQQLGQTRVDETWVAGKRIYVREGVVTAR